MARDSRAVGAICLDRDIRRTPCPSSSVSEKSSSSAHIPSDTSPVRRGKRSSHPNGEPRQPGGEPWMTNSSASSARSISPNSPRRGAISSIAGKQPLERRHAPCHDRRQDRRVASRGRPALDLFFSVRDSTDNGTVVDFLQRRQALTLGGVRKELRAWLRVDRPRAPVQHYWPTLEAPRRDPAAVAVAYACARDIDSRYPSAVRSRRDPARAAIRRYLSESRPGQRSLSPLPSDRPGGGRL